MAARRDHRRPERRDEPKAPNRGPVQRPRRQRDHGSRGGRVYGLQPSPISGRGDRRWLDPHQDGGSQDREAWPRSRTVQDRQGEDAVIPALAEASKMITGQVTRDDNGIDIADVVTGGEE